jgi:PAS domain S-box-containing protein
VVGVFAAQVATAVANAQLFAQTQDARQLYAGLFEDSIDPILISDLSGRISDVNHSAEVFMGYAREELWGDSVLSHHVPSDQEVPTEVFNLEHGQTVAYEGRATHKDAHPLPVEVHVKRIDIEGQPFLQWILRDISERLELEELRSDLTSMIFHDLRSPLGNVISSLEVLKSSLPADDETLNAVLAIAQRSSRRLSRLIDSLLDLERLEAGKAVLNREPVLLEELIEDSVEEVRPIAEAKGHALVTDIEAGLPELSLDRDMVQRVLINLLDNAIKYTRSEGHISVKASTGKREIVVSVRDTGPGIPEEEQGHLFEKFTRLQHEPRPKGLGLGLAFCQLAVEAHGGTIWLQSAPGEGSTFFFSLPIK